VSEWVSRVFEVHVWRMFENRILMQETGENNAWRRFIVHILNQCYF